MDLSNYKVQWVGLADVNIGNTAFQFRKDITPESVVVLAKSLKEEGQKFPVILWEKHIDSSWSLPASGGPQNDKRLQLISGFRRVTAAKSLNWEKVLAIVIPESDMSEQDALRLNFIENIERKTLTNLDIMFACKKLKDSGKTNADIGLLIGKSEVQVRRYILVAEASPDMQNKLNSGETTIKAAAGHEQIVPGDDSTINNKNIYVKSSKKVFE